MSAQILDIETVIRRPVERSIVNIFFTNRHLEPFAEALQFLIADFFLLMGYIFSFTTFTQTITLDRTSQDDGRFAVRLNRLMVRGINLAWIVTAQTKLAQVLIRKILNKIEQTRIGAEKL